MPQNQLVLRHHVMKGIYYLYVAMASNSMIPKLPYLISTLNTRMVLANLFSSFSKRSAV